MVQQLKFNRFVQRLFLPIFWKRATNEQRFGIGAVARPLRCSNLAHKLALRELIMLRYRTISAALLLAASLLPVHAEEGMWTFDNVPVDKIAKAYGFRPDQRWLDHVRLSSVRLGGGCSAAFVSPTGRVQTNHLCPRGSTQQLSPARKVFSVGGFSAR